MSSIIAIILIPILIVSYNFRRSLAAPEILLGMTWFICYLGIYLLGNHYYKGAYYYESAISVTLVFSFMISSILFAAGLLNQKANIKRRSKNNIESFGISVRFFVVLCLMVLPLYIRQQADSLGGAGSVLFQIRRSALDGESTGLLGNFYILSLAASLCAQLIFTTSKLRRDKACWLLSILISLAYGIFSGSKLPVLHLIISQCILYMITYPRKGVKIALYSVILSFVFLLLGIFYINFAGDSNYGSTDKVLRTTVDYVFGGVAAFQQHYGEIMQFENNQNIQNSLRFILNRLGYDAVHESIHYPFVSIGPESMTNVYTFFFPLIKEYGIVGAYSVMFILGGVYSILYFMALRALVYRVFYSLMAISLVGTIFGDPIFYGFLTNAKYFLATILIFLLHIVIDSQKLGVGRRKL